MLISKENVEHNLLCLLEEVWSCGITTKSDRARAYADAFAEAASRGFITTLNLPGHPEHGSTWRLAPGGLLHLFQHGHCLRSGVLYVVADRSD